MLCYWSKYLFDVICGLFLYFALGKLINILYILYIHIQQHNHVPKLVDYALDFLLCAFLWRFYRRGIPPSFRKWSPRQTASSLQTNVVKSRWRSVPYMQFCPLCQPCLLRRRWLSLQKVRSSNVESWEWTSSHSKQCGQEWWYDKSDKHGIPCSRQLITLGGN